MNSVLYCVQGVAFVVGRAFSGESAPILDRV